MSRPAVGNERDKSEDSYKEISKVLSAHACQNIISRAAHSSRRQRPCALHERRRDVQGACGRVCCTDRSADRFTWRTFLQRLCCTMALHNNRRAQTSCLLAKTEYAPLGHRILQRDTNLLLGIIATSKDFCSFASQGCAPCVKTWVGCLTSDQFHDPVYLGWVGR